MAVARSVILKISRSWGDSSGWVGIRSLELRNNDDVLTIPGYGFGDLQGQGSDSFAGAPVITGALGASDGISMLGFTLEVDEPSAPGYSRSAWYTWTAPQDGVVLFNTRDDYQFSSSVKIEIFTGSTLQTLVPVSLETDYDGSIEAVVTGGQEYRIRILQQGHDLPVYLRWGMVDVYKSVDGAYAAYDGRGAFLDKIRANDGKLGTPSEETDWLSETGLFDNDGYIIDGDYIQLVMVLPYSLSFNKIVINNYHYDGGGTGRGVRDIEIFYTDTVVSQADAENDSVPISGEKLFNYVTDLPKHVSSNVVDDYVINEATESTLLAGIGLGFASSGGVDYNPGELKASLGVNFSASGGGHGGKLTCGLALGATMSGGGTHQPGELLAGIELSFQAVADRPTAVKLKAGLCLTCLMKSERIPDNILKFALAMDISMGGYQKSEAALTAGLFLGFRAQGSSGPPPCLAQKFQHIIWF